MSCKKRHGTTYLKETPDRYPTFAACMKACGALPACLSVDYHTKTKNCYFSTNSKHPTVNAASFVSAHSAGCSGACASCNASSCADLDKGPLGPEKYTCNEHRGRSITVKGIDFVIACEHAINSHPFKEVPAKDHAQCVELCAAETSCGGANWIGGKKCYHHPDKNQDGSSSYVQQRLDSDAYVKIPGNLFESLMASWA